MSYALKRKVLAVALSLAGVFSARAQDVASVTIPMSFAEFYRIVENAKRAGLKDANRLPKIPDWEACTPYADVTSRVWRAAGELTRK